ncbi:MAG: hypothetical protein M3Z70_00335 [Bartonella sp.]|nr:hypothetical protein [Bartonella sp.]
MPEQSDPVTAARHSIRKRFFILLAIAIILVGLLIWMTLAFFDVTGIDALNEIV